MRYSYNAFGEPSATGGVTTGDGRLLREANPFRYASYQYDEESKFYYLKSRYYIPFMGRFLTRDKVSGYNLYAYCENNPVNLVDSDGYYPKWLQEGVKWERDILNSLGLPKNTTIFKTMNGARIPDFVTKEFIGEIKKVAYQANTRQLRAYMEIAKRQKKKFKLVINETARLSKTVLDAVRDGAIILMKIPLRAITIIVMTTDQIEYALSGGIRNQKAYV